MTYYLFERNKIQDSREMMDSQRLIDDYLKEVETHLGHISVEEKYQVIQEVRDDIKRASEAQPVQQAIKNFGGPIIAVNRVLNLKGLPLAKAKKRKSIFKVLILSLISITVVSLVAGLFLVRSILPFFEINEKDGTLKLFGGKIVLEKDDATFMNTTRLKTKAGNIAMTGEISLGQGQTIQINGKNNVDLAFRLSGNESFVYDCKTNKDHHDFIKQNHSGFIMELKGETQCLLSLPPKTKLIGKFQGAHLNLKNLENDLDLSVERGHLSWKQEDKALYKVEAKVSTGNLKGPLEDFSKANARYKAKLEVILGNINVR